MPYTTRHAIHDGKKGLTACINYCLDKNKTEEGLLVTGVNCSSEFAASEFLMTHSKFHAKLIDTDRVAYHAIQSFNMRDDITPEQVNKIGVELCNKLYPDFQCIVSTHIDKGHLHNHIIINAMSMMGRKLEDKLSNQKEGLYGLREVSDSLALDYGCHVIENAPKIGKYKRKEYVYTVVTNWKQTIKGKIEILKEECYSFDEMIEKLSLEGYELKSGKHIGVRPFGKKRFSRLSTIGEDYSEESLKTFFYSKRQRDGFYHFEDYLVKPKSEVMVDCDQIAKRSKNAIVYSEKGLQRDKKYLKYYNARYMELKRYKALVRSIEILNKEKIHSYDDLASITINVQEEIEDKEQAYMNIKALNAKLQSKIELANIYLNYYNRYKNYEEQKKLLGERITESEDVKIFMQVKEKMQGAKLSEVKEILINGSRTKQEANKQFAYLSYLKQRAVDLDKIRMLSLDQDENFIKGMSFNFNMIDHSRTTDANYCVRLPYTHEYVYLNKECVLWTNYNKRGIMYLINDEEYRLFDDEDHYIRSVDGEELEKISLEEKERIIHKNIEL